MHAKKWSFEGYIAPNGQINLFVLDGNDLEALIGRWEAADRPQFFRAIKQLMADESAWRTWQYVDADVLATNRTWQMVSSGTGTTSKDGLRKYYECCSMSGDLFFRSYPDGGALRVRNQAYPFEPGGGLGRGRNKDASPAHP